MAIYGLNAYLRFERVFGRISVTKKALLWTLCLFLAGPVQANEMCLELFTLESTPLVKDLIQVQVGSRVQLEGRTYTVIEQFEGGAVSRTYKVTDGRDYFVLKIPRPNHLDFFENEVATLFLLAQKKFSVPKIISFSPGRYLLKSFERGTVLTDLIGFETAFDVAVQLGNLRRDLIEAGIMINDLRAPNLMIDAKGKLLLLDPGGTGTRQARFENNDPFHVINNHPVSEAMETFFRIFDNQPQMLRSPEVLAVMKKYTHFLSAETVNLYNSIHDIMKLPEASDRIANENHLRAELEARLEPEARSATVNELLRESRLSSTESALLGEFLFKDLPHRLLPLSIVSRGITRPGGAEAAERYIAQIKKNLEAGITHRHDLNETQFVPQFHKESQWIWEKMTPKEKARVGRALLTLKPYFQPSRFSAQNYRAETAARALQTINDWLGRNAPELQ